MFRQAGGGPDSGRLAAVKLGGSTGAPAVPAPATRSISDLSCVRVYGAAGAGACLTVERGAVAQTYLMLLDGHLKRTQLFPVDGTPSRTQISADGRMVSWTTFIAGETYTNKAMATRTGIFDRKTGRMWRDLEKFKLYRDGTWVTARDLNYWGVTFTRDDDRFYATARTGTTTYLVEGKASTRTMKSLRTNVECPSLSPDGTRLAFKKATGDPARPWRLHILDLATMRETPLAETNSVDDQAAWIDDKTVAYGRIRGSTTDIWSVPADGSGTPRLLLENAFSPAAIH
ncbi:hypothetical protein J4573_48385 [Actinomadura barringtoniae]|uniref:TolB-like translocation protein n=1 Tax=Actinomadura barringtoniae TaxID=1427535 RepID=A0A939PRP0_9ACTN|nr:hypothetical protein [Actinomadura barringtoniae]MBO2454979.1 hypothetical protein [Actinomadura barringtoniae]